MNPTGAIIVALACVLCASDANANGEKKPPPQPQESGLYFTSNDKSEHAAFGALLGIAGRLQFRENRWHALAVPVGVSALKEVVDSTQRGNHFSGRDLAAGFAGGILGVAFADGALYLARENGATKVVFSKAFE